MFFRSKHTLVENEMQIVANTVGYTQYSASHERRLEFVV